MKKILVTICGIMLMSIISLAQRVDSTQNLNENTNINSVGDRVPQVGQSDSTNVTPGAEDKNTSREEQFTQPEQQTDRDLQSQPEVNPQPIQPQSQVPTQRPSQPLDPTTPLQQNPSNENQMVEPLQPAKPVNPSAQPVAPAAAPTTPTGPAPLGD